MTKSTKIINHDENSESDNNSVYNEDEFILCRKPNGEITSCGFSVNSALLREGKPIMSGLMPMLRGRTKHRHEDTEDDDEEDMDDGRGEETEMIYPSNVSDMFSNLSIPAGIFYMQQKTPPCKQANMYEEEELNETIFDKLLALASESEKRKRKNENGTRKVGIVLVAGAKKANKTKKMQKDKPTKA